MKRTWDVVALGDVNLDFVVAKNLSFSFSELRENGLIYWESIDEMPGGSALNFCVFAAEIGCKPMLLSKIGDDAAGAVITRWLKQKRIALPANWRTDRPTGKALVIRDHSDVRLLINSAVNANHYLDRRDIRANQDAIADCRILYVSGYCISEIDVPRFEATLLAMDYAKSITPPPTVVFDVVPHRIYERLSFDRFRECTRHVDILISEAATARRFLGLGSKSETIDDDMVVATARQMGHYFRRLVLRFGPSGCDKQMLVDLETGQLVLEETHHNQQADKRGFGDRLAITALREFFGVL